MKSMLKSLMSVAVAALAFTSCSNDATEEVIPSGGSKTLVVNATIDQTRTSMDTDHVNLNWAESDVIYLYIGRDGTRNEINPKTGGTIKADYTEGGMVYANYSIDNSFSKGATQAEINIENKQTQSKANVFAGENLPMVAKGAIQGNNVNLKFQPVGCVLVFNVYGPAGNEKIKSITFNPGVICCGWQMCDLTAETLGYVGNSKYDYNKSVTVELTTPAAIGAAKPGNTTVGENQVYMVVAPFNYSAATFTVTTDAGEYTFTTANGIDCSQSNARVVNLNLTKAPEFVKEIIVPTVPDQPSTATESNLTIEDIKFKNFTAEELKNTEVSVYNDADLTLPGVKWLSIVDNKPELTTNGTLYYTLTANESTEARTAYIVIKCGDVTSSPIAVTQVAQGVSTAKYYVKVTEAPEDWTGDYLIVYENSDTKAYVLDGSLDKIDAVNDYISVDITEQGILSNETTNASLVKILKIDGGYTLQAAHGQYIYSPSNSNQLKETEEKNTAANSPNSISIDGSSAKIESKGSVLRFNSASNQMRFRYYKSSTYTDQKAIQLYKLQE